MIHGCRPTSVTVQPASMARNPQGPAIAMARSSPRLPAIGRRRHVRHAITSERSASRHDARNTQTRQPTRVSESFTRLPTPAAMVLMRLTRSGPEAALRELVAEAQHSVTFDHTARKITAEEMTSGLEQVGLAVVDRYGTRIANDLLTDDEAKRDPAYFERLLMMMYTDPQVTRSFLEVANMLKPATSLMAPNLLIKALKFRSPS